MNQPSVSQIQLPSGRRFISRCLVRMSDVYFWTGRTAGILCCRLPITACGLNEHGGPSTDRIVSAGWIFRAQFLDDRYGVKEYVNVPNRCSIEKYSSGLKERLTNETACRLYAVHRGYCTR